MEEVLGRYIAFQRMSLTFKKKLIVSLVYPTLLVVVVVFMLIFLVTFVVPQFAKLFADFNAQLPASTLFMLKLGDIAQQYGLYIVPACTDCAVCASGAGRAPTGARRLLTTPSCSFPCWGRSG